MLSMVESGQRAPSIRTLMHVSKSLGVTVSELVEGLDDQENAILVTASDRKVEKVSPEIANGTAVTLASMRWNQLKLNFYEYFFESIADSPAEFQHPGFWFISVLEGSVAVIVDGQNLVLHVGDTLACDTNIPHHFSQVLKGPVRLIGFHAWGNDTSSA